MDFRERYKRLGFDPDANRALRSHRRDEARRGIRDEQMSLRREMGGNDSLLEEDTTASTQQSTGSSNSQDSASYRTADSYNEQHSKTTVSEHEAAVDQRWQRLQKWREEKNKRKQVEKRKAKPVFKVGVVHHRVYSPPVKDSITMPPPKLCKTRDISANMSQTVPKRVTRATEKRMAIKNIVDHQKRENARNKKKAQPQNHNTVSENKKVDIAPEDHQFKAPMGVTAMPIFGRQALAATKEHIQAEIDSFQISSIPSIPAINGSFDESSMSLRISSEDEEVLDESVKNEVKPPLSRRSSKNISLPAADEADNHGITPNDQEMMEVEKISTNRKNNDSFLLTETIKSPLSKAKSPKAPASPEKITEDVSEIPKQSRQTSSRKRKSVSEEIKEVAVESPRRTRSTRAANKLRSQRIASTDSADSGIEHTSPKDSAIVNQPSAEGIASASIDSTIDSTLGNKENMSKTRRKSIKIVTSDDSNNKTVSTPPKEVINRRRSTKLISSSSTDTEEYMFSKPADSRRRSTKFIPETEATDIIAAVSDVNHSPLLSHEPNVPVKSPPKRKLTRFTVNDRENFENTNLMDFTFSAPAKPPKVLDAPKSLLDDTLANLTPRRSSRLPSSIAKKTLEEDQPLIRFSSFYIPTPATSESSSSEPIKQNDPDDLMSLSLNISLPKETEELTPPVHFSPYIVQSRGKNSARKEMKKRRFSQPGLEVEDIPTKDNIMQKLNISVEEEERTAQYYTHILNKEIERLNGFCERWNVIMESPETPEDARYVILAACGQTRLLINKKFERFRSLVKDCETGRGEMLVTCKDLQGFWEMMYMEINNCDTRFNKLEEMKANNWVEKEDQADVVKEVEKKKKKAPAKKPLVKKPAVAKSSSLRAMIAAARKKKIEADGGDISEETAGGLSVEKPVEESENVGNSPSKACSSRMSTPKSAGKRDSLLKKVQLSQTRKSTTSPLVVMKLGQMVKTPEVQLDDSIVYINCGRTPAKSILKKDEVMGSVSKSTNKVFFGEHANEVKEFEIRNSFVDENMSLDDIEEVKEPIERKLDFEDESFVENVGEKNESMETTSCTTEFIPLLSAASSKRSKVVTMMASPMISISPLSLEDKKPESPISKNKSTKTKKQISFKEVDSEVPSRSLRTKKLSAPLTPRPKRSSQEDMEEDTSAEVDDSTNEETPRQNFIKEIYLNEQGVVCERFVPVKKATPGVSKVKRSNSETTRRGRSNSKTHESDNLTNTPVTPQLRRRNTNISDIMVTTPHSTTKKLFVKDQSSSQLSDGKRSNRSSADNTITQDSVDISMEETTTPKRMIKTPKTLKAKLLSKESPVQLLTPTLSRTRSLKVTQNQENQTVSPKLRRTKSLNVKEGDIKGSPREASIRKSMKKLQENIEPNQQATDLSTAEKIPRTPSYKRKSSKKQLDIIEQSEKLTNFSDRVSETMTPNTRRKSLRITRASIRDEN